MLGGSSAGRGPLASQFHFHPFVDRAKQISRGKDGGFSEFFCLGQSPSDPVVGRAENFLEGVGTEDF